MPPVGGKVIKDRALRLRAKGDEALARHLQRKIGSTVSGLVERPGLARAEDFKELSFEGGAEPGSIVALSITGHNGRQASAVLA